MNKFKSWLKPDGYLIAGFPNEGSQLFEWLKNTEKRILRPKVFKSLHDKKAEYKPLGHVATAKQIKAALNQQFITIKYDYLPNRFIPLYNLFCFKINNFK